MTSTLRTGILGIGTRIPDNVLTNDDLARIVDTTDEWIVTRTGIRERRLLSPGELLADYGAEAARRALDNAGVPLSEVDLILACTYTPDRLCPSLACDIHHRLGPELGSAAAFDLNAACSGFLYGLHLADKLIATGTHRRILLIALENHSGILDFTDRSTCILFGDGASAVVLGPVEDGSDSGIYATCIGADGEGTAHIQLLHDGPMHPESPHARNDGQPYLRMNGREVFKYAARVFGAALDEVLALAGMSTDQIDFLIPHQANMRIIRAGAERIHISPERVVMNIERYGNTASVSIPLGITDLLAEGRLKKGDTLALVAFGAGYTYGAAVVKW